MTGCSLRGLAACASALLTSTHCPNVMYWTIRLNLLLRKWAVLMYNLFMCKRRCPRGQGSHAAAKSAFLEQLIMLSGVNSAEFERGHSAPRVTLLFHLLHQGIMPDDPLVSSCPSQLNSATQLSMQCYTTTYTADS